MTFMPSSPAFLRPAVALPAEDLRASLIPPSYLWTNWAAILKVEAAKKVYRNTCDPIAGKRNRAGWAPGGSESFCGPEQHPKSHFTPRPHFLLHVGTDQRNLSVGYYVSLL